jgi:hypothetical protein
MKRLAILMLGLGFLMVGCNKNQTRFSNHEQAPQEFAFKIKYIHSQLDVYSSVKTFKGHEWIVFSASRRLAVAHLPECKYHKDVDKEQGL